MKHLTLLLLLLILIAVPICSAQQMDFPYIFTGTPLSCGPVTSCFNAVYIPQGWYGQITEAGVIQCYKSEPWAHGFRLNLLIQASATCTRSSTLIEAYLYITNKWNYAAGNPWATNNVIYAAALQGTGLVYAIINNNYYLVGQESKIQDCYTGGETQSGGSGGTC